MKKKQSTICPTLFNREPCVQCCLKHLGQARAIVCETKKGYPEHYYFAMGHMAEAEDEIVNLYPEVEERIRSQRYAFQEDQSNVPDWAVLVRLVLDTDEAYANKMLEDMNLKWQNDVHVET